MARLLFTLDLIVRVRCIEEEYSRNKTINRPRRSTLVLIVRLTRFPSPMISRRAGYHEMASILLYIRGLSRSWTQGFIDLIPLFFLYENSTSFSRSEHNS